jgi:4-hydroxy-tetrahydrodipicolinate synthase
MDGIGPPLVTPFTADGDVDEPKLRELVTWVEKRGVDFLVPCGSNGEAELMTLEERTRVIDVVADAASVPVLAGTGHPGLRETVEATARAARVGADGALVVTPFYYDHDAATIEAHYRDVADAASAIDVPVYLYNVPSYTDTRLAPATVAELATHPNVAGMKDSTGDVSGFVRHRRAVDRALGDDGDTGTGGSGAPDDCSDVFSLLVGSGGVLAPTLDQGGDGGVLALANVAPEAASEVYRRHCAGDDAGARELNAALVELNHAVTAEHGIPGLKAAMRSRGAPAGYARRPHRPVDDGVGDRVAALAEAVEELV